MGKLKVGVEFFVVTILAMITSLVLLCIFYQEETIDAACEAIENHDQEMASVCIDKVWDVNSIGPQKQTMLMVACESGNQEAIELLVNRDVDPNHTVSGALTPLELFCKDGYEAGPDALLVLLNSGARQSVYTVKPAIFYLAESFYWMTDEQKKVATEEVILLLQHGAPLGYNNTSLLHLAAKGNMADLFYTIVHTKDGLYMLTMKDADGNTPWDVAVKHGSVAIQQTIRNLETEYEEMKKEEQEALENQEKTDSVGDQPVGDESTGGELTGDELTDFVVQPDDSFEGFVE